MNLGRLNFDRPLIHKIIIMSPRTKEQIEEIRNTRINEIFDASLELFAENGYHRTSISMIAKKAGIAKGLIYNYFKSKEDLLTLLVIDGFGDFKELMISKYKKIDSKEKFRQLIDDSFNLVMQNKHHWRLYYSLLLKTEIMNLISNKLYEMFMPFMKSITEYFIIKGSRNPKTEAILLFSAMDGLCIGYFSAPKIFPFDEATKILTEKFE